MEGAGTWYYRHWHELNASALIISYANHSRHQGQISNSMLCRVLTPSFVWQVLPQHSHASAQHPSEVTVMEFIERL
jgi:hypothetical protein